MSAVPDVQVLAVGIDAGTQPVLLLQESTGAHRVLPIWVGHPEAIALEVARRRVSAPRPATHQLIGQLISIFGRRLERVRISDVRDDVFLAELILDRGTRVSARPSDAVTLALHLGVPIQAEDEVLDLAGLAQVEVIDTHPGADSGAATGATPTGSQAAELERFRRFLDGASPEDFDTD